MACHYVDPGPTPIVVKATYVQFKDRYAARKESIYAWMVWLLVSTNLVTGWARLTCCGAVRLVSVADLSRWHLLRRPAR